MGKRLGTKRVKGDAAPAIRRTVKLKLTRVQEAELERWLWHLTGIYNWALRKIELDAGDRIYHRPQDFVNLLVGTAPKLGIPSQVIQATLLTAYGAWQKCFKREARKPRLKGRRNRLNSIPFPDRTEVPAAGVLGLRGFTDDQRGSPRARILYKQQHAKRERLPDGRVSPVPGVEMIDALPKDKLRGCRLMKRASGWYASIVVEMPGAVIPAEGHGDVGIDPGYDTYLTLSDGEKVEHPRELQRAARRLAQAQRGGNARLAARLQERVAHQRLDRNHKLARELLKRFALICMSKDNLRGLARGGFGKSVTSAGHGQLRRMLASKRRTGGETRYVEVPSKGSTRTCSTCGASTGPTGRAGLKVRRWVCTRCQTDHDRDVNAAVNTLIAGGGQPLESYVPNEPAASPRPLAA